MKTKIHPFATGIYTVLFGLFGLRNFYLGEYLAGSVRLLSFFTSTIYFTQLRARLRINLSSYQLIDNLYTPSISTAANIFYHAANFIMGALLLINILWWLRDLYYYFFRKTHYPTQTLSNKGLTLTALLLGWTGMHDYQLDRIKYANLHIILLIISIAAAAISQTRSLQHTAEYNGYMSILFMLSLAILIANEIIAIIEISNYWLERRRARKAKWRLD